MWRVLAGVLVVMALGCATGKDTGKHAVDSRLEEAQGAFDKALQFRAAGEYAKAREPAGRALRLREAVLGVDHPEVAQCLNLLGATYLLQHELVMAESLLLRALAIREKTLGAEHIDVASSLNNLGNLYDEQGRYHQARCFHERALLIRTKKLGSKHPDVALSLHNLATIDGEQGLYGEAEVRYESAIAITQAALGDNHPQVALSLNNLANLYSHQGLYDKAAPLLERALDIWKHSVGVNHPRFAASLHNLASLYVSQGLYDKAEPLLRQALMIREGALGPESSAVASTLSTLSNLYANRGLYDQAEPLMQRARVIWERTLGDSHPQVAQVLNNLANLYNNQGLYEKAEPLFQKSLTLYEQSLGEKAPDVAVLLNNFALLRVAQHRLPDALPLFSRAFSIFEQRLRDGALAFSESLLSSFLHYLRASEQPLYALVRAHPGDAQVRRMALGVTLLLKGRSVEETASISRAIYRGLGVKDRDTFERLRELRTQLAARSSAGPGSLSPAEHLQQLATLATEADALEAVLSRNSARLRDYTALPSLSEVVDRVATALPRDGALVEFIAYTDNPLVSAPGASPGTPRYLALVLFPDATTRAVDLGPAEPIDTAASRLRTALADREPSVKALAQRLHHLAFQPLLPLLGTTRRLLLSPDGQLGLVSFDSLHDGHGYLIDSFDLSYLTSGRELLRHPQDSLRTSVVVFADPDFTAAAPAPSSRAGSVSIDPPAPPPDPLERLLSAVRADRLGGAWNELPGTRQEAQLIQRRLPQAQLFLGPEATKERLIQLPTPGILHLATHGVFVENAPAPAGSRAVHFDSPGIAPPSPAPPQPLLRSALVLAGARAPSTPDSAAAPLPSASMVTALELAGLDLWGTQLVVLSACDTGRGDVQIGQGIQGLRRSFMVAGAETVVMSLWTVNDGSTPKLMDLYYRNLLSGQGRAAALRDAMRALRASHPNPHDWAPFIVLGSDAPLRAITAQTPGTPGNR